MARRASQRSVAADALRAGSRAARTRWCSSAPTPFDPFMTGEAGRAMRALRAQAEATLARLGGGIGSEAVAVPDRHPAHALARVAAELGAAAIVAGSSHTGRLRRIVPGRTGEHLLEAAPSAARPASHRRRARARLGRRRRRHPGDPVEELVRARPTALPPVSRVGSAD
jgi:nucleotide-binding universal stress UspA family protein